MLTAPVAPEADTASIDTNCASPALLRSEDVALRTTMSVPALPPSRVSAPAKPMKLSSPAPPVNVSAKAPPVIEKPSV